MTILVFKETATAKEIWQTIRCLNVEGFNTETRNPDALSYSVVDLNNARPANLEKDLLAQVAAMPGVRTIHIDAGSD